MCTHIYDNQQQIYFCNLKLKLIYDFLKFYPIEKLFLYNLMKIINNLQKIIYFKLFQNRTTNELIPTKNFIFRKIKMYSVRAPHYETNSLSEIDYL